MSDDRLYVVRYSFDIAVAAVDDDEAIELADDALAELLGLDSIGEIEDDITKSIVTDALLVVETANDADVDDEDDEDEDED